MEKTKFFEKVKSWFIGLLVLAVLSGVVVLLFIPDDSFSKLSKGLTIWPKSQDSEINQMNKRIDKVSTDLKLLKSSSANRSELDEIRNQITAVSEQVVQSMIRTSTTGAKSSTTKSKNIESRPITNPTNLETRSLASQPKSNLGNQDNSSNMNSNSATTQVTSSKININTASAAELDKLPGIGPTYSQRIIDYRDAHGGFKSISEIQNVKGIGPKTFEKLKDMIEI